MEPDSVINEEKRTVLTPVNEFLALIQQRYNWNPNSLAAGGYREVLKLGEQFIEAERSFMNAAYMAGYEQAFEDLKKVNKELQKEPE
jgi:hypothetical protein